MRRLVLLLVAPLLLAACASQGASPTANRGGGATAQGLDSNRAGSAPVSAPAPAGALAPKEGIPTVVVSADRNLILTAKIDMRSKDPWATSDRAQLIATSLGGDVLSLSQAGSGENRSASLTIRVPSSRFSDAIRQLKELDGEVVTSAVSAQDVTDQFVDLQARLTAKQSEEQRYLALLARASTIDEILKIDSSLANVRLQIEQLTGQINSIKSRTEFSMISMTVSPIAIVPVPEPAKAWDPAKTVARALAALGAMLQVFADLAIWLVVFGWLPLIALAGALFATRARRPAAPTVPTA
ncbi:MAG TPA: DUF4349 domain-containing protein [Candidatus Limnocylindria bacterium]|nr:DUF4349 domain-containing protein [Candidatus Limnocylindria bacterium]